MRRLTQHIALLSGLVIIHQPPRAQQGTAGPVTTAFRADAERGTRGKPLGQR